MSSKSRTSRLLDSALRLISALLPEITSVADVIGILYLLFRLLAPEPTTTAKGLTVQFVAAVFGNVWVNILGGVFAIGAVAQWVAKVRKVIAQSEADRVEAEERKLLAQERIATHSK